MISQRDIVLLSFPFSNFQTTKVRPTIVVSNDEYNRKSKDIVVVPMTSKLKIKDYTNLISLTRPFHRNLVTEIKKP